MTNRFDVGGNLTADAVIRSTPAGSVCVFTVAENLGHWDRQKGEFVKTGVNFWEVNVWDRPEEAGQLRKGQRVAVQGRLKTERFEVEGAKREKVILMADRVTLALPRVDGGQQPAPGGQGDGWATATPGQESASKGGFSGGSDQPF